MLMNISNENFNKKKQRGEKMLTEGMKYLGDAEAIMLDRIEQLIKGNISGYKYREDGWARNSLRSYGVLTRFT